MNFNYQKARDLMVENQLRPNKINDPNILSLFKRKEKEVFLPENLESLLYSDMDIKISSSRGYLKNLHIAQLIKYAEIKKNHKILHIGALTGYVTSLLSELCLEVFAIEEEKQHLLTLENNINSNNVNILKDSFIEGNISNAPFDRIFIDCPTDRVNEKLLNQLSDNLGQIIMIERNKENLNKAIKITRNKENFTKEFLFDVFSNLILYEEKKGFVF